MVSGWGCICFLVCLYSAQRQWLFTEVTGSGSTHEPQIQPHPCTWYFIKPLTYADCLHVCLIQGPFLSHLLPGSSLIQSNLMIIYKALLSARCCVDPGGTKRNKQLISGDSQLSAHSHLTWYLYLSS